MCIETDLKGYHLPKFQICANLRLWLKRGGPTKLEAPTDKVIYRAKHSSSKVQLKTLSITLSSKNQQNGLRQGWIFSVKVTFTMISSSQVHIFTILSNIFNSFSWQPFSHQSQIQWEWLLPLWGIARERCCRPLATKCIYPTVCLFVKKSAHYLYTWCFLHQWHLLQSANAWNPGNYRDPLELKTPAS